jgi:hypothetical protein
MSMTFQRARDRPYAASPLARRVFRVAGIYGLIVMLPQYFLEARIGRDFPPAITHPEYFYGFIGIVVAWQCVFLLIASDPRRYRPLMLVAVVEKLAFAVPVGVLLAQGRLAAGAIFGFAAIDLLLAACFIASFLTAGSDLDLRDL